MSTKSKPLAVLISDVHYGLKMLKEADASMRQAIEKAEELDVSLIVAGDLHDTKANLRGECTNAMVETFGQARCPIELMIGNHDKINEKSEAHALTFLEPFCNFVINEPRKFSFEDVYFYLIPYYHNVNALREYLKTLPKESLLIMHQGLNGSDAGEYFNDKSALDKEDVKDFRVVSGHYHRRQDIKTGRPRNGGIGLWSFIGTPYTMDFKEHDHPDKGFQVLYSDGSLEFIPTNLRRHVKIVAGFYPNNELFWSGPCASGPNDLVWVIVEGPSDLLTTVTKDFLRKKMELPEQFRLELVPTDRIEAGKRVERLDFDAVIDVNTSIEGERKIRLKALWKGLISEDSTSQSN